MNKAQEILTTLRRLERRRVQLLPAVELPPEGLFGALSQSRRECGSPRCHCHAEGGHLSWTLTFMVDGKRRVEHVPAELLEEVGSRLEAGKRFKAQVAELMSINAQLLVLDRRLRKMQQAAERKASR